MKILATLAPTASEYADKVDALFNYLMAVTVFFSIAIPAVIVVFAVKYRRKSDADRPAPIKDGKLLEILGSVIPFVLVMVMFFWGAKLYFDKSIAPKDSIEILVTGKQWMWKIQHPNGKGEINDMHVPVGVPIKLTMTSVDVIHNFFLPEFRTKMDVVPGKYTTMWFEADETGVYEIFCAEYCGTQHAMMKGKLYVVTMPEYLEWLESSGAGNVVSSDPIGAGEQLWQVECASTCHGQNDALYPNIERAFGTMRKLEDGSEILMDDNYVKNSMINPGEHIAKGYGNNMTPFGEKLTNTQMNQIIAYLKSQAPAPVAAPAATEEATEETED